MFQNGRQKRTDYSGKTIIELKKRIDMQDERYLRLLSEKFPNAQAVVTELINLRAILSLPKGTEHFVSDLHGESSAFIHMIKNASGVVRKKVDEVYGDAIAEEEKRALCALIYYPDERIELIKKYYQENPPQTSAQGSENQETPPQPSAQGKEGQGEYVDLFRLNSQISNLPTLRETVFL